MKESIKKVVVISLAAACVGLATSIYMGLPRSEEAPAASLQETIRANTFQTISERGAVASAVYWQDDLALSARHVCTRLSTEVVILVDSKDRTLTVVDYAVSADPGVDACILKIKRLDDGPLDYPGTKISASELPMDALVIIGSFSGGGNYSIRSGRFYLEDFANIDSQSYLITFINIPIEGGASGSGAVNSSGELVGIVSARSSRETLLVPLSKIKTFLFKAEETKRFRE